MLCRFLTICSRKISWERVVGLKAVHFKRFCTPYTAVPPLKQAMHHRHRYYIKVHLFVSLKYRVAKLNASCSPCSTQGKFFVWWRVEDDLRSLTAWRNKLSYDLVVRQPYLNIATVTHASRPVKVNLQKYYPCWHWVGTGATVNFPWKSLWKFANSGPSKISKPRRNKSPSEAVVWTKACKTMQHSQPTRQSYLWWVEWVRD